MAFRIGLVICLALVLIRAVFGTASDQLYSYILSLEGRKLNHVVRPVPSDSISVCCAECSLDGTCIAISYNSRDGVCELNDRNPLDFPDFASIIDSAWVTFVREVECPEPDWVPFNRACYKVVLQSMDWDAAQQHCISLGGHLTDILDDTENRFVSEAVSAKDASTTQYWIGLRIVSPLVHGWISGAPLSYSNFAGSSSPSYENGNGEEEDCIEVITESGVWNDRECSVQLRSVCEKVNY